MATVREIEATYGFMTPFGGQIPLRDLTAARFAGNFGMSLEEAQRAKHDFIFDNLRITRGSKLLDIGSGLGSLLLAARNRGIRAFGVTLDRSQALGSQRLGLNSVYASYRDLPLDSSYLLDEMFGENLGSKFDGVSCVEAMEHFCGPKEYKEGRQEVIYREFFRRVYDLTEDGGRMFLQAMVLGENAPKLDDVSLQAPKYSNEYITAKVMQFYPGSFPPENIEQIKECASPYFDVVLEENGRVDYIETMKRWSGVRRPLPQTVLPIIALGGRMLIDSDLRARVLSLKDGYNRQAFEKGILNHWRLVFQKRLGIFLPEHNDKIPQYLIDSLGVFGVSVETKPIGDDFLAFYIKSADRERTNFSSIALQRKGKVFIRTDFLGMGFARGERIYVWGEQDGQPSVHLFVEVSAQELQQNEFLKSWAERLKL